MGFLWCRSQREVKDMIAQDYNKRCPTEHINAKWLHVKVVDKKRRRNITFITRPTLIHMYVHITDKSRIVFYPSVTYLQVFLLRNRFKLTSIIFVKLALFLKQ